MQINAKETKIHVLKDEYNNKMHTAQEGHLHSACHAWGSAELQKKIASRTDDRLEDDDNVHIQIYILSSKAVYVNYAVEIDVLTI